MNGKLRLSALAVVAGAIAFVGVGSAATTATSPPANTSRPSISGSARDGAVLTAHKGGWTNNPTSYAYAWLRCDGAGANCGAIGGANGQEYTVTTSDVGHTVRVQVTASNSGGSGTAMSNPTGTIQSVGGPPKNTAAPSIGGNPQENQTLTANPGGWSGAASYAYEWQRCDANGNGCAAIPGASGQGYNLVSADVAHTLRVRVVASNSHGGTSVTSGQTALIAPAKVGAAALSVTSIALPDRLVVDSVKFSPQPLRRRAPLTARFHVSDLRGFSIQGALVYALGLPYGWVQSSAEVPTDTAGWATITIVPTRAMPVRRRGALVVFVRARKPGEDVLAGVSTRRLVQASVG